MSHLDPRDAADAYRVPPELIGLPARPWYVRLWRRVIGYYR